MKGIDISNWQKGLDLSKASVDFAIFKASGGKSYKDPTCENFVKQAKAKGILWGFYHFARDGQASQSGATEADWFIKCTEGYWGSGLPVLDLEDNGISDWAKYTKDFVNRIYEKKKVYPVIYTGLRGIAALKGTDVLKKCKVWFAGYPKGYISYWLPESDKPHNYYNIDSSAQIIMWQFTSNVPVAGFNVDANLCYITKAAWKNLAKGSSLAPKTESIDCAKVAATMHADMCIDDDNGYAWSPRKGEDGKGVKKLVIDGREYQYDRGSWDCSSSIIECWKEAIKYTKYKGKLDAAATTHNMRQVFRDSGLFEIWDTQSTVAEPGDVYLNDQTHTAMCQPPGEYGGTYYADPLSEFCINEKGEVYGGKPGDQTGKEAYIHGFYGTWDCTLHYNGKADYEGDAPSPEPTPGEKPTVKFRVKQGGKWLAEGKVGQRGMKIQAIAIKMTGWYQVRTRKHGWLPPVTGYNINDHSNGYAGWADSDVLDVRCYFETQNPPPYYKAKYRVSPVNKAYFDYQYDNETFNGQDGYAGNGVPIDRFEIKVEQ